MPASPLLLASVWSSVSLRWSNSASTGADTSFSLSLVKASSASGHHSKTAPAFSSLCRGAAMLACCGTNFRKKLTSPKKRRSSVALVGLGMSTIAESFLLPGRIP
uniref:Putative secreted protein n=1 Tax=Ixodes ricinus TaxID=34613 RepID=A0A6B0UHT6_IXORI